MSRKRRSWKELPLRTCRWMNHCELCNQKISDGEQYRDGGHGRRAHEECVDKMIEFTGDPRFGGRDE